MEIVYAAIRGNRVIPLAHSRSDVSASRDYRTGLVARYKVEDYELAAAILRQRGFSTSLMSVEELQRILPAISTNMSPNEPLIDEEASDDQLILLVSREPIEI